MKKNEFLDQGNEPLRQALNLVTNGQESQGLQIINDFLAVHANNPAAYRAKAMALAAQGDYPKAIKSIRVAIDLHAEVPACHYVELGEYLLEDGAFVEAFDALTTAIDLIAKSQDSYYLTTALIARAVASYKANKPELTGVDLPAIGDDASTYCAGEIWTKKKLVECLQRGE